MIFRLNMLKTIIDRQKTHIILNPIVFQIKRMKNCMYGKKLVKNSSRCYLKRVEDCDTKLIIVYVKYFVNACGAILRDSHSTRDIPVTDESRTRSRTHSNDSCRPDVTNNLECDTPSRWISGDSTYWTTLKKSFL